MTRYRANELGFLARRAGFAEGDVATVIAIALAESGGNSEAVGDTTIQTEKWGPSIGLMQVRSLKAETGTGSPRDASRLTDPDFNMASAFSISGGGKSFRPWTTYTRGTYLRFLPEAKIAAGQSHGLTSADLTPSSQPLNKAVDAVNTLTGWQDALAEVGKVFHGLTQRETWVRVLEVLTGLVALVLGAKLIGDELAPNATGAVTSIVGMAAA